MAHIFTDNPPDIEPLPVEGTHLVSSTNTPPPHDISLDRHIQNTDFDDSDEGMHNFTAVKRIRSLLQRGFRTPDNPDSDVPRGTWLVIAAELMVAIHQSIRASHGANPSLHAFSDLDQEELALFNLITKVSDTFYQFFEDYQDNTELWETCLRCLEQCCLPIDQASYNSVAMTCGQSINAIHATVVNEKTREIHKRVHDWGENLYTTITNTFTDQIISDSVDAQSLLNMDDPRLANWLNVTAYNLKELARAKLLDEAVDQFVVPWASERLDTATDRLLATDGDRIRDLRAEAEKRANNDSHKYYNDLLPSLREEARERARADAYASFAEDQARFRAEADAELAAFKHSLRIEVAERKSKAQEAADKSVSALTRSSAKANKGKGRHDPIGRRSRAPSVSASRPPSPTTPSEWPPTDIPAPSTPEVQVATLIESAPLDTTPKAAAFQAADKAAAPILAILGERDRAKAELTFDSILSSVAANTEKQLLAFGSQIAANLTKQMTLIVEPISKRLTALEGGYDSGARADDEDANRAARDLAWGRGQELVPSSDPNEVEMLDDYTAFADIPGTDPNYKRADPDDDMVPPFLDLIYRRVHQVPDNVPITHRKHVDELHEMKRWFDFFYLPHTSHDIEIDRKAESLPQLIEQDIAREYKEWYETGETVPAAPRPAPKARTP